MFLGVIEALGSYHPPNPLAWLAGQLLVGGALLVIAWLEQFQLSLRAAEASRWWASNGRDVLNALAVAALWLALRLFGFSGPIGLLASAIVVLLASLLQSALARVEAVPRWVSFLVMLGLGAPLLIAPAKVHDGLRAAVEALF